MGAPSVGEVVLLPFPFSDLSQAKVRPVICLADATRGDWVFCQVTSSPYGDPLAIKLESQDLVSGGLHVVSYVRPGKLFTAHESLVLRSVGTLRTVKYQEVLNAVLALLQSSAPP